MMNHGLGATIVILTICAALVQTGCKSPKGSARSTKFVAADQGSVVQMTRNNCYSLLHQLLAEQKNVNLLRFIKREHAEVKGLIKSIASESAAGASLLEKYAKTDPTILLNDIHLPPGETATRDAIAETRKKELMSHSGDDFELRLLLTQAEALSYAWHLAKVAGEQENYPERARGLAELSDKMKNLHEKLFQIIASRTRLQT